MIVTLKLTKFSLIFSDNTKLGDNECTNSSNKIYLLNGFNSISGRVAVCGSNNRLHNICDNGWSREDATVICTELGHQTPGCMYLLVTILIDYLSIY